MAIPFAPRRRAAAGGTGGTGGTGGRDTAPDELHRMRAELDAAAPLIDHPIAAVRLGGLLGLVRLADTHAPLRQAVVTVLGAYLRRYAVATGADRSEVVVRRAVLDAVRDHLRDPGDPVTWCGLDVDLSDSELVGDLSGIVVTGGAVRLDRARVPAGSTLDVSGARVTGGLLTLDRLQVAGRLDAALLSVTGGEVSLDRLVLTGGEVVLDGVRLTAGRLWLRDGSVESGTVSLRGLHQSGGQLSLHDTRVRGGQIRLDGAHLDGGALHLSGATVEAGAVRLDDLRLEAGVVSLALAAVRGGLLSLDGATVGPGGSLSLHGLAVDRGATVRWGTITPVQQLPAPAATAATRPDVVRTLDLRERPRGSWELTAPPAPTAGRPPHPDLPSPRTREAS